MATFFNSYQIAPGATFHRYRLETLALSALLVRKWKAPGDRLALVTDAPTAEAFKELGVTELYDDVVIPPEIEGVDPSHFFALIKLRGLSAIPAPVYSIDWDLLILTQDLFDKIRRTKARGLHYECTCGVAYKHPGQYAPFLPAGNYDKAPINAGVIGFESDTGKRRYCDLVFEFMRRYSAAPLPEANPLLVMMFAEQQLLGYLKAELGVRPLFAQGTSGMFQDRSCFHLWGLKFSLDGNKAEGDRHRQWCRDVMSQHGLDCPTFLDSPCAQALP